MATPAQMRANRSNAQKSTGPKSTEGKARSSRNAFKHGVLSDGMVAEHEDAFEYELLLMGLKAEYNPCTMSEVMLVERLANLVWRERRLAETEAAMLEKLNTKADMFAEVMLDRHVELEKQQLVGRYQGMLGRQISDTRRELREEQTRRSAMSALDAMR